MPPQPTDRGDGTSVATPVWFVTDNGRGLVLPIYQAIHRPLRASIASAEITLAITPLRIDGRRQ